MAAKGMTNNTRVVAMWWCGVVIAAIALFASIHRQGDLHLQLKSPFDNTRSGHAEQWIFLSEAAEHVPRGASYTVMAPDRGTEMSLFMMAVGLLPEARPLPSSYYGQATAIGDEARFVLELEKPNSDRPPREHAIEVTGGRVTQRPTAEP